MGSNFDVSLRVDGCNKGRSHHLSLLWKSATHQKTSRLLLLDAKCVCWRQISLCWHVRNLIGQQQVRQQIAPYPRGCLYGDKDACPWMEYSQMYVYPTHLGVRLGPPTLSVQRYIYTICQNNSLITKTRSPMVQYFHTCIQCEKNIAISSLTYANFRYRSLPFCLMSSNSL